MSLYLLEIAASVLVESPDEDLARHAATEQWISHASEAFPGSSLRVYARGLSAEVLDIRIVAAGPAVDGRPWETRTILPVRVKRLGVDPRRPAAPDLPAVSDGTRAPTVHTRRGPTLEELF
jgi:hypothetical protein